jgi:hypothetical protein
MRRPSYNNENQSRSIAAISWHIGAMRKQILTTALLFLIPLAANADDQKVFRWTDAEGQVHYGDHIPPQYAEFPKDVLNDHGVTIENLEGKKTAEQLEQERIENERRAAQKLQHRADQALLATYLTVEEIWMHRDRRVELFQAQSRVTELYLSNLARRLEALRKEVANYQPYSEDPDAPMIPQQLADQLKQTKETIDRHERNLKKFRSDEQQIISRFAGDISRFKTLKGIGQE